MRGDSSQETSCLFTEDKFFGREVEKQTVIRWLKSSGTKIISICSIIGVGGVGKTALAQNLFDHQELKGHFEIKMWVCVSNTFEEKVIIQKMLESLTEGKKEIGTLNAAQSTLKEKLMGKNFLLVLDDVWNDKEREKWDKLIAPLRYGGEGSKILLTTRMESVADMVAKVVGETKMSLNINGLEERQYSLLFEKYAFAGFDPNDYPKLQSIGNEISKKLRGIPLAIKTIGGMLNNKLEDTYWARVLKDRALDSDSKESYGIMAAITLSYEHLRPELKPCFRYCSIFPQDHEFVRNRLVHMWISVGLIPEGKNRQEELANEFFETLVQKSFFQPKKSHYIMHDLLHELAEVLSKNECLRVVSNPIQIPQSIRHLSLKTTDILVLKNLSELKYLRSLLLDCDIEDAELVGVINTALKGFKTVRYLELSSKWLYDFPKSIGDLVHLRCLSIIRSNISRLSQCVCALYHLQILEFTSDYKAGYFWKGTIPADICKLSKLKRLDLPLDATSMVPHIGKLTSLEQLRRHSVKGEAGYDISELEMMSELCELEVTNLENVKSTEEASKAKLNLKQHLFRIVLVWGDGLGHIGGGNESDKKVADCLQPHSDLKELTLDRYRGTNLPNWLEAPILPNLTAINLSYCGCLERLAPLGQFPYLKFLTLKNMDALKEIGSEFYGSKRFGHTFPLLETFELTGLMHLEEWREDTISEKCFPRLKRLVLIACPSLSKLPPIPTGLEELELNFMEIATLPEFSQQNEGNSTNQGPWSLSSLYINECSKLTSLSSGLFRHPERLASIETLEISNCTELVHLPLDGFGELINLKSLRIKGCRRLFLLPMLLPKTFFPPFVQRVVLSSCGELVTSLPQLLPGLFSISFLELVNCAKLISLPSANVMRCLTSLKELVVRYCLGLKSLGGLEAMPSLKVLKIGKCPMLTTESLPDSIEESSMALDMLQINGPELLSVVPLRNLHLTKSVLLWGEDSMTALPEQWLLQNGTSLQTLDLYGLGSLQSLPDSLWRLPSLRILSLKNAYKLTGLPQLPTSLVYLYISECSEELAERIKEGGLDYDKVKYLDLRVYVKDN